MGEDKLMKITWKNINNRCWYGQVNEEKSPLINVTSLVIYLFILKIYDYIFYQNRINYKTAQTQVNSEYILSIQVKIIKEN